MDWLGGDLVESLLITSAGTDVTLFGQKTLNISSQNISSQNTEFKIKVYVVIVYTKHRMQRLKLTTE